MTYGFKWLSRRPIIVRALAWLIAQYISLVFHTTRWQKTNWHHLEERWLSPRPFIFCFWHNRLLMATFGWQSPLPFHMLISSHADGRLISQTVAHYNINTIVGSKSKGGTAALQTILKILKAGGTIGITPDGPRGPRFQASEGIAAIAKLSGLDVIPFTYSTRFRWVLKSWDRFILALPFGRGILSCGSPLTYHDTPERDLKSFTHAINHALQHLCDEADMLCGHLPLR